MAARIFQKIKPEHRHDTIIGAIFARISSRRAARYEHTEDTLAAMAADFGVSERTINRTRDRGEWKKRSEREPR